MKRTRSAQLKALIKQSFDIFNVYGKDPDALKNIYHGFNEILEDFKIDNITAAFRTWMREQDKFPTPADIRKILMEITSFEKGFTGQFSSGPPKWTQCIHDWETDEMIEERCEGTHLAPMDIHVKYPAADRRVFVRMKRDRS